MNGEKMVNILFYIEKLIDFEPVKISELLTFISSIILLFITWRSVSNAKKSNEITEEALKLQKQQFSENIKPILVMKFPEVIVEKKKFFDEKNVPEGVSEIFGDYRFKVENKSKNISYNVRAYVYLYSENEKWIKYKEDGFSESFIAFTSNGVDHLDNGEKLTNTIPYRYFKGRTKELYSDIYVLLSYEDKVGTHYEDGYKLRQKGLFYGESYELATFEPIRVDVEELKETVLSQKIFLEKLFDKNLGYYFVPK